MSNYLKIIEKTKPKKPNEPPRPAPPNRQTSGATKATKATKAPIVPAVQKNLPRDKSDQRVSNFTPLTVSEALAAINRRGSGASKNAELYRRGELSEETAVEYVTCAILHRRGESFEIWRHHAPAVRKALTLCIHEMPPEECAVCSGRVRQMIEEEAS